MINSDRRLKVARDKLRGLQPTRDQASTSLDQIAYDDLTSELQRQVDDYEAIKSGAVQKFSVEAIDELGPAIVRAQMARGLTQRQLAWRR
ncbi:MAG: hypothetical protein LH645_07700 [Actinomycetia bacterium]|nr:hypothetical protein [Actinomycetes bacterium]